MSSEKNKKFEIVLRRLRIADREKILEVEAKTMLNFQYLPEAFNLFASDQVGEFSIVEVDGGVVACGKYTVVPDKSAWHYFPMPINFHTLLYTDIFLRASSPYISPF